MFYCFSVSQFLKKSQWYRCPHIYIMSNLEFCSSCLDSATTNRTVELISLFPIINISMTIVWRMSLFAQQTLLCCTTILYFISEAEYSDTGTKKYLHYNQINLNFTYTIIYERFVYYMPMCICWIGLWMSILMSLICFHATSLCLSFPRQKNKIVK